MIKNAKFDFDENLLNMKNHPDLVKNYAALKNTSNYAQCKVASYRKCEIINPSEVSRVFNGYAEKMSAIAKIEDEKLLKICQEIKKLNDTAQMKKNNGQGTANCTNETIVNFEGEEKFVQNNVINTSFSKEKLAELSSNPEKELTNHSITVDDFLTMHNQSDAQTTDTNIVSMQDDEVMQNDFEEHSEFLEEPKKKMLEMKNSSILRDQTVAYPQKSTERPYVCSKCQKTFKRNLHLKRHFIVAHTPNKNFKCDICEKLFSRKDYLDKHIAGHQKKDLKIKLLEQGIVVRTKIFSKSEKLNHL